MTEDIQDALLGLEAHGSFAVRRTLPVEDLVLEIKGPGPISFPITAGMARELIAEAVRSPFGWRDQTITDLGVRDGWQIAKSRIKIDGRRWNPVLRATVDEVRKQLGLPSSGRLKAHLDKLTIYGPGQFFKAHQDTEKSDRMIGTLVIVLPSHYTGGTLKIDRHGQRLELRRTVRKEPKLDLIAFYSDCHHEVRPVKSGYRIALVYTLDYEASSSRTPAATLDPALAAQLGPLRQTVEDYFAIRQPIRFSSSRQTCLPEKLVYLLDHEYTPRNLGWSRLKQADSPRALALRDVARQLDLEVFLCLADIHESWQCEPEFSSYRGRSGRWSPWYDDDDNDDIDDEHNPIELIDSTVELKYWQDGSGAAVDFEGLRVDDSEVCFTTATNELDPVESNYEGYMGNYGDTLDRWYHRAAVVLWPRSHEFSMLVKADPASAIQRLLRAFDGAGLVDDTEREHLRILLDLLPDHARVLQDKTLASAALRLALAIDDATSATRLLEPLAPRSVSTRVVRPLLALAQHYGKVWCEQLLSSWHTPASPHRYRESAWSTYTPQWLARLTSDDPKTGLPLARTIVDGQWAELREELAAAVPFRARSPFERDHEPELTDHARAVLQACTIVDARKPFHTAIKQITSEDSALSPPELADIACALAQNLDDEAQHSWGVHALLVHARSALELGLADLQRKAGDWSILVPTRCSCQDCTELHAFLRSPDTIMEWPLAKNRRSHVHQEIDRMGLPVTHVTRRQGRPFTLVLNKTTELLRLEEDLRDQHQQALASVERLLSSDRASGKKKVRKKRSKRR
ncbi:MAG: 2OG-Fe(II) oxygenase [Myxococcota bacterium]